MHPSSDASALGSELADLEISESPEFFELPSSGALVTASAPHSDFQNKKWFRSNWCNKLWKKSILLFYYLRNFVKSLKEPRIMQLNFIIQV